NARAAARNVSRARYRHGRGLLYATATLSNEQTPCSLDERAIRRATAISSSSRSRYVNHGESASADEGTASVGARRGPLAPISWPPTSSSPGHQFRIRS